MAYFYDDDTKGLAISVGKTGRKSFLLYRKIQGRPERIKIGRYPDVTIEQAHKTVAALNTDIAQDLNPAESMRDKRSEMTLADFFKEYYERHSSIRKDSPQENIDKFNLHINTDKYGMTPEAIEVQERRKKAAQGNNSPFVFPGSGGTGHLAEPRAAWERMLARSTAWGLVEALAEKATAKTFDYPLALEEAIDFPVQTIERYTPLAEKHGLHLQHYEMRDLRIHDLRRTLGSCLVRSGTSLPIIGKVLSHKAPEATQVYARLMVAPVRNAMEEARAAMRRTGEL